MSTIARETFPFLASPTVADASRLVSAFRRRPGANAQIGRRHARAAWRLARNGGDPREVARLYESARFHLKQMEYAA